MIPFLLFVATAGVAYFSYRSGYIAGGKEGVKIGAQAYERQILNELARVGVAEEPVKPEVWN